MPDNFRMVNPLQDAVMRNPVVGMFYGGCLGRKRAGEVDTLTDPARPPERRAGCLRSGQIG